MALGEDYTQEQYQQWLNDRQHNDREDQLAYDERDIMEDDDE
jgi:AraC-like DNA-binding protein